MDSSPIEARPDKLQVLRHDIKNQLSNIYLALEALRYEVPNPTEDYTFYVDAIATSAAKINSLLADTK